MRLICETECIEITFHTQAIIVICQCISFTFIILYISSGTKLSFAALVPNPSATFRNNKHKKYKHKVSGLFNVIRASIKSTDSH